MTRPDLVGETQFTVSWLNETDPSKGNRAEAYQNSPDLIAAVEKARQDAIAREGENPQFIMWGTTYDRKVARIGDVIKIADKSQIVLPRAAKKAEKAVTKRSMMVEGSKWRFTRDVALEIWVDNPKIDELCHKRDSIYRSRDSEQRRGNTVVITLGGGRGNTPAEDAERAAIQKEITALPRVVKINGGTISEGTEITVIGKLVAGYKRYGQKETNGLLVPVTITKGMIANNKIRTSGYEGGLPYSQIEGAVEAISIPETIVFVMRDRVSGDYFGGWQTENNGNYSAQTNEPKMSSTFSGAKKYANASAAKASIRDFTGYNDGLDDEGGAAEWVNIGYNTKKMDLPATWELVGMDKTTNVEKSVEDLQTWYTQLMRLRVLTKGHGSAVRGVYKKAEGKGFEAILLFSAPEAFYGSYDDDGKALIKKIDGVTKNFTKKPLREKSPASIAFACMLDDAYLGKLSFGHRDVTTKILDINSLEEIVSKNAAST